MRTTSSGLWSGGYREFLKALRQEERDRIAPLQESLKSETDPKAKRDLKDQIKTIRTEFRRKRKQAHSSLFMKT